MQLVPSSEAQKHSQSLSKSRDQVQYTGQGGEQVNMRKSYAAARADWGESPHHAATPAGYAHI